MTRQPRSIILNLTLALLVAATVSQPVWAVSGSDHESTKSGSLNSGHSSGSSGKLAELKADVATRAAELRQKQASKSAALREKLEGQKLKSCEKRQQNIQEHLQHAADQSQKHLDKLSAIADKVDAFKTSKNITVDNYSVLQQQTEAAQAEAEAAITVFKQFGTDFTCTSDGPKAQLQSVKDASTDVRTALKTYRSTVKNLTLAVRQANGQRRQATSSATPSASPAGGDR